MTFDYLGCNTYNYDKTIIYNFGEYHGMSPKLNLEPLKNKTVYFYVEINFRLYNLKFNYPFFIKFGSKKDIELRKKYDMQIYSSKGFDNIYYLKLLFSNYYFDYKFIDESDKKIIENSKQISENWKFIPSPKL